MKEIIDKVENHVKDRLSSDTTGHDWWHCDRVRKLALRIATDEGGDRFIIELAALLHDLEDWKFNRKDSVRGWLSEINVDQQVIDHVCAIINTLSFKGAGVPTPMKTVEGKIVQDADRLDALGAIGIARAFSYGGFKQQPMHIPSKKATAHQSFEEYKQTTTTINHFHEKLLLLKQRLNTETGRKMAEDKHKYMLKFVDRFTAEWNLEG